MLIQSEVHNFNYLLLITYTLLRRRTEFELFKMNKNPLSASALVGDYSRPRLSARGLFRSHSSRCSFDAKMNSDMSADGPTLADTKIYNPTHTIHIIRHGQSMFNVVYDRDRTDPMIFDAPLSPLGEQQVLALNKTVKDLKIDLIVTSPLTRAIQTAVGGFAGRDIRIVVCHLLTEVLSGSGDIGREPEILAKDFPQLDFTHLNKVWWFTPEECKNNPDFKSEHYFKTHGFAEKPAYTHQRVEEFRSWLKSRPEKNIAIVGHHDFFYDLSGADLYNCGMHTLEM